MIETLESCINQSYRYIEVIVVDDGSKDHSFSLVEEYANCHPQVKVYQQPNSGACKARNNALFHSKGNYIVYLDADDVLSPGYIERNISALKDMNETCLSFCEWGKWINGNYKEEKEKDVYKNYENIVELIEKLLNNSMLQTSCWFTPRRLIEMAGEWNESLLINQDGEFFMRVLANANRALFVPNIRVFYRYDNNGSITRSKSSEAKGLSLLQSYIETQKYLQKMNIWTERICEGLVARYQSVAYMYLNYKDIYAAARYRAKALSVDEAHKCDGSMCFQMCCRFFGFWNMLRIKRIILKII